MSDAASAAQPRRSSAGLRCLAPWVDLRQSLAESVPYSPPHGAPAFTRHIHWRQSPASTCEVSISRMNMGTHTGTHVDAARHFYTDGRAIDEYPLEAFIGEGIVVDLPMDTAGAVTAEMLDAAAPKLQRGDIVFIHFGFAKRYLTDTYFSHPYLTEQAALFLVERGIRMIGVDALTPDMPHDLRGPDFDFPVHRTLLRADVLIVENLGEGLARLAGRRVSVVAVPLNIVGADGAPVAPIGRLLSAGE
jgi:arylformamidase